MSVFKRPGAETYSYDFKSGGQRFSGSTGETNKRTAEAVIQRLKGEAKEALKAARRMGPQGLTLDAAADRYWTETAAHTATPEKVAAEMRQLVLAVGPAVRLADITDAVVAGLVAKRRAEFVKGDPKRGLISPATVNRTTTQLLRRILTRAKLVWKEQLPAEPHWRAHMLKEPKGLVRELRYDEEEKLAAVERDDYRAPRVFAQLTGLRRREVAGLRWEQIDFGNGTISVVGKGDKPHVLPITEDLEALLRPLQGHHPEAVFTFVAQKTLRVRRGVVRYVKGQRYPVTYEGLGTHFQRTVKKAGIKGLRIHDLRHTAATRTLRATGNLRLVQQMLAHSSPTTTAKYAHASLDDMREGMTKAGAASAKRRTEVAAGAPTKACPPEPIHFAIAAHRSAWDAYRASSAYLDATGREDLKALVWPAQEAETEGVQAILSTPCGSPEAAAALASHLQWYAEAYPAAHDGKASSDGPVLEARLADLLLILGRKPEGEVGPVTAAIDTHRLAWAAFTARPRVPGVYDEVWHDALWDAHHAASALLEVPCGSLAGARGLLAHLEAFLPVLTVAADDGLADGSAGYDGALRARAAELRAFLGVGAAEAGEVWATGARSMASHTVA